MKVRSITIVSLSRGILGESFVSHELALGLKRLEEYGIQVHFSKNALKGIDYLQAHPEARAQDLLEALQSDTDMILCAIGGDDTYRLLPHLFDHGELASAVSEKIFLGFSDSTINHLMLHKVGMPTFYGQAFLPDVCEIGKEMLPYSRHYFEELLNTGTIRAVSPAPVWYDAREDFGVEAMGTQMPTHENSGFELLQGASRFEGEILGGCIDSLYDLFNNERYADSVELCRKYELFPKPDDWKGKILLLETSEERPTPEKYRRMVRELKRAGVFGAVSGVLVGKPYNELHKKEYETILREEIADPELPIVANINIGHATPRCIIPFGVHAVVDAGKQEIQFHTKHPVE